MKKLLKTSVLCVLLALIVGLSSCEFKPVDDSAETDNVSDTQTKVVTDDIRDRLPKEIYDDAMTKINAASAYDVEIHEDYSATTDAAGTVSGNTDMRIKFIADGEGGPLYYNSSTVTGDSGSIVTLYTYGDGIGYYSDSTVSVKSTCSLEEFRKFNSFSSDEELIFDLSSYETVEVQWADDNTCTITYTDPTTEAYDLFYSGFGISSSDVEGSANESISGTATITPEGYLKEESVSFRSDLTIDGQTVTVDTTSTWKLISIDDPSDVSVSIPANTSGYTEIESLYGLGLVNSYSAQKVISSMKTVKNFDAKAGGRDVVVTEDIEYLSSEENNVYTGELSCVLTIDGADPINKRFEFDGSVFRIFDGVNTQTQETDPNTAYTTFLYCASPYGMTMDQFEKVSADESDDGTTVTCDLYEEYADYYSVYFLQYLFSGDSSADFSYILTSASKTLNDAHIEFAFDSEGVLKGYDAYLDAVYTDATGMETVVKVTVSAADMVWYE